MRPRLLFSFHFFRDADMAAIAGLFPSGVDMMADSGAFTAYSIGAEIKLAEYAAWLRRWARHITCAAALDDMTSGIKSLEQTEELRQVLGDQPFSLVPVFHATDEGGFAVLERYIEAGYDWIGLSPVGLRRHKRQRRAWISESFRIAKGACGFHGFGIASVDELKLGPWRSADATSWIASFRHGQPVSLWDGMVMRQVNTRDPSAILASRDLLESYGLSPDDLRGDRLWSTARTGGRLIAALVESSLRLERYLNERSSAGTRLYMGAFPRPERNSVIADGVRLYLGTGPNQNLPNSPAVVAKAVS